MGNVLSTDVLTTKQIATVLGVTDQSVRGWCRAGAFPNAVRSGPMAQSPWVIPLVDFRALFPDTDLSVLVEGEDDD